MHHFVFGLLFLHVHNKVLDEHFAMHVVIISLLKICLDYCYQILDLIQFLDYYLMHLSRKWLLANSLLTFYAYP
jgi:hypothetical protein